MKKMILRQFLWALFFTGALAFTSCQENEYEGMLPSDLINPSAENLNVLSPEGGTLSFLDGNVVLAIPAGAVGFTEHLTVNACQGTGDCPYLLAPVTIEPFVIFKKPVELSIRYSGCLCKGNATICQGICIDVNNWGSFHDFQEQIQGECCNAKLNEKSGTIDITINHTGVFAVSGK